MANTNFIPKFGRIYNYILIPSNTENIQQKNISYLRIIASNAS